MNSNKDIAIKFAKENHFDTAIRSGKKWNGELMYVASLFKGSNGQRPCTGLPQFIIIEGKKPRFAKHEELRDIMGLGKGMPVGFTQRFEDFI